MKNVKLFSISFILVLVLTVAISFIGNVSGSNTPEASAFLSRTEAELCLELNTYISGPRSGQVDGLGLGICLLAMNED